MNKFDALLARAVEQARALGIPVSARISPAWRSTAGQ